MSRGLVLVVILAQKRPLGSGWLLLKNGRLVGYAPHKKGHEILGGMTHRKPKWWWLNCIVPRNNQTGETSEERTSCHGGEEGG